MAKLFEESGTNWAALLWLKAGHVKWSGPTSPTFTFTFSQSTILLRTLKKHGFSCALCGLVRCPWMKQRGVSPSYLGLFSLMWLIPDKKWFKEERVYLGSQFEGKFHHDGKDEVAGGHCFQSQGSREKWCFAPFYSVWNPGLGIFLLSMRTGLPTFSFCSWLRMWGD